MVKTVIAGKVLIEVSDVELKKNAVSSKKDLSAAATSQPDRRSLYVTTYFCLYGTPNNTVFWDAKL